MSESRPVFVTGASGLMGARLCAALRENGVAVRALSRRAMPDSPEDGVVWYRGEATRAGDWLEGLEGVRAVIHLAGEPVAGRRWSRDQKRRLRESRVHSTRLIARKLSELDGRPEALICASATGYYGARGDERLDESAEPGSDFLARLCVDWERAAIEVEALGIRVVRLRFGVVLSPGGGALARMQLPYRLGLGGPVGPAHRGFPWIHADDALGVITRALDESHWSGAINCVAPEFVDSGGFARSLGRAMRRPAWLGVPLPLMRLALGEMAESLVPGQHIEPRVLETAGFAFRYPGIDAALAACV